MADHLRGVSMLFSAVQVLPGEGTVVRAGDVLLWWEPGPTAGPDLPAQLVGLVHDLAVEGPGAASGAGARLAEVLRAGDALAVAGLVLALPSETALRVAVVGAAQLLAPGIDIPRGWVDTEIAWPPSMALGRADGRLQPPVPGSPYDLVEGGTPGAGAAVVLAARPDVSPVTPVAEAAPAPAPAEPDTIAVPVEAEAPARRQRPLRATDPDPAPGTSEAAPTAAMPLPPPPAPAMPGPPRFSPEPAPAPPPLATQPPPAAVYGAVVLDDGSAWALDGDYLIGTNPTTAPEVIAGSLRALPVTDPSGQTYPAHAEVRHGEGGTLVLVARATTYLLAEGSAAWQEAPLQRGVPLQPGVRVAIGQRTFTLAAPTWTGG